MRAIAYAAIAALTLTAGAAAAQATMKGMSNMPGMATAPAAKTGKGTGVVKAVDLKAGTVTLQHGPIPAIGWPAMTMAFKAKPPALLTGLKVGQNVDFDVRAKGMDAEVTAITKR